MKVYTKVVFDMKTCEVIAEESYEYDGPVAQCASFGKTESSSKPTRVPRWSREQRRVSKMLGGILEENLTTPPVYPGRMYVPATEEEEAYFRRVPELATELAQARARLGQPAYMPDRAAAEEFFEYAVRAPALKELQEVILPSTVEKFAKNRYWSTARTKAEQDLWEDYAAKMAAKRAEVMYQFEQDRQRALSEAAQREAQYFQPMTEAEIRALGEAGAYRRGIEETVEAADLQKWLMEHYNPFIGYALQYLGLSPFDIGQKTSSSGFSFGLKL